MKKIIFSAMLSCIGLLSWAQSNTTSTGGDAIGSGGSVSYSVGQIDYISGTGSNGSVNQGVQQPFEFYKDVSLHENSIILTSLYPNPTNENVVLKIESFQDNLSYQLFDINGKLVRQSDIDNLETIIEMHALSSGEYHLSISKQHERIESIKIIKH